MSDRFKRLVELLKELFQLDHPDLDFGIYRIMLARRAEVTRFLEHDLLPQVREAFASYQSADKAVLERQLAEAIQQVHDLGVDPDASQKVKELRARLATEAVDLEALEGDVYDHLYRFFRRYYHEGDFISKRVYKEGVYAIPYEGEEVKLHWANHDQYYIKTSEYLRDYTFRLRPDNDQDPMRVHFRLVDAAEGAHNNVKESSRRVFVLTSEDFIALEDGPGGKELVIRFEYRPATLNDWPDDEREGKGKAPEQKDLLSFAEQRILSVRSEAIAPWIHELAKPHIKADGEEAEYSRLRAHLNRYTARNTFDYFIHKDLGGFLRRELDFYIKNEVIRLDDIEGESHPRVEQYLSKVRVIRKIAHKIIDFLAQLEDFQKKLWLKKKFVTETSWCVRVGIIPEEFYPEICANNAQREEWVRLHAINEFQGTQGSLTEQGAPGYSVPLTPEFLAAYPTLMIDTRYFSESFTARLLEAIGDIDARTDGVLVHSENFQALNLIRARCREQVDCVYIDPPYNSPSTEILYKNDYKHSSWLSLMENRIAVSRYVIQEGVYVIAIDENELQRLAMLLDGSWLAGWKKVCVAIRHNPRGTQGTNFSYSHDYAFFAYPSDTKKYIGDRRLEDPDIRNLRDSGLQSDRTDAKNCFYPIVVRGSSIIGFGDVPDDDFHPTGVNEIGRDGSVLVWPIDTSGKEKKWRFARQSVEAIASKLQVRKSRGKLEIYYAKDTGTVRTLWLDAKFDASEYGTKLLQSMFGRKDIDFSYPKSLHTVEETIRITTKGQSLILDYFAGSGTTGHAVINLNREDSGRRKFILVEMADYFDTVLLPRLKKVTFTPEWKDGKPRRMPTVEEAERSPRILKVIRLESYEDTLNNLELKRTQAQQDLFSRPEAQGPDGLREQYILRYMLDVETRESPSLLNIAAFTDPTQYRLRVKTPGSDESRDVCVDLIETFNWLIGLVVHHISAPRRFTAQFKRAEDPDLPDDAPRRLLLDGRLKEAPNGRWWFRTVEGETRDGRKALVIWRNRPGGEEPEGVEQDNLVLDAWFQRQGYSSKDSEFDLIYVNGTNNLENLRAPDDTWKVRLIEEDFYQLMFDTEGA